MANDGETSENTVLSGPTACPVCGGDGVVTFTDESRERFFTGLECWSRLREASNVEMAGMVSEIEAYLAYRDLSPLVSQWLTEVWWRLHAASEPIEETRRKIDALSNDPEWLESD